MKRFCVLTALLASFLFSLFPTERLHAAGGVFSAQDTVQTEKFAIYYQRDSISIDTNYLSNRRHIARIRHYLMDSPRIDSITIYAWASPEGGYEHNRWLSGKRAESARDFLLHEAGDSSKLNADKIKISPLAENWPGLVSLVEQHYYRTDRDKVLRILRMKGIGDETRKWRLAQLDRGRSWRYLIDNYMPELRAATWVCVWAPAPPLLPAVKAPEYSAATLDQMASAGPGLAYPVVKQTDVRGKKMILAARTNLLIPGLNVGLEFPIRYNWSLGIDYYYPWAVSKKNRWCGEMLGLFVDARYWITGERYRWTKADRLQGHAVGLYGGAGYYDYQNINEGYQGEYIDTGVDYTFGLPVGPRGIRWMRIEFNVGVGWIRTWARHYVPSEDYSQLIKDSGIRNLVFDYFGPTRASVSFLLPISVKTRKGGGR